MIIYKNLNDEIWKDIEGYNKDYKISNYGRIKSLKFRKEKILKTIKSKSYLIINLWKDGIKETKYIHILVFETFNNYKLKDNECIHHKDENKYNNFIDNLIKMNNSKHKSLHFKNINNPNIKLTEQKVIKIHKYLSEGILTQKEIGKLFNVTRDTISDIKTRRSWKYINLL